MTARECYADALPLARQELQYKNMKNIFNKEIINENELTDMFGEGGKEEVKEYEQGDCQECGEPLNNGEGELCFQCKVVKSNI